jgi:hypothetical protein
MKLILNKIIQQRSQTTSSYDTIYVVSNKAYFPSLLFNQSSLNIQRHNFALHMAFASRGSRAHCGICSTKYLGMNIVVPSMPTVASPPFAIIDSRVCKELHMPRVH